MDDVSFKNAAGGLALNRVLFYKEPRNRVRTMKLKNEFVDWLARRLPACKEVTRMASDVMEHNISLQRRIEYKLHLMICSWCMRYVQQLETMREVAHQHTAKMGTGAAPPASQLSGDARERMKQALRV